MPRRAGHLFFFCRNFVQRARGVEAALERPIAVLKSAKKGIVRCCVCTVAVDAVNGVLVKNLRMNLLRYGYHERGWTVFSSIKQQVKSKLKAHIVRSMPRGVRLALDIAAVYPGYRPGLVFDVGANVGHTARGFVDDWPGSRVECFEPVASTYATLRRNVADLAGVTCHKLAMGSVQATVHMQVAESSSVHGNVGSLSLLSSIGTAAARPSDHTEEVRVHTVGDFCDAAGIDSIGLLKVDTEGHDLEVLKGAGALLDQQKIDWVQVEAGMSPSNELHVPFDRFTQFMSAKGYWLFGLYDQFQEWPTRKPYLRRANPVFLSQRMVDAYQRE